MYNILVATCNILQKYLPNNQYQYKTGLNGGYYTGALQQAHSTTPHDAPHSVGGALAPPPTASNVNPSPVPTVPPVHVLPQVGLQLGLVSSKSVGTSKQMPN